MCIHQVTRLDSLGREAELLKFIDCESDTCDYVEMSNCAELQVKDCDLTSLQLNVRGLLSKQSDLLKLINSCLGKHVLDCITLQETWLTPNSKDLAYIPGYKHHFETRSSKKGGRVSVLVKSELRSRKLDKFCKLTESFECCCVEIDLSTTRVFCLSIYRPPGSNVKNFQKLFNDTLRQLNRMKGIVLIGTDHNLDFLKPMSHKATNLFVDSLQEHSLMPCITWPTRITHSSATLILCSGELL